MIGQERDWAFLTATELEERVLKTKRLSFARLASSRSVFPVVMMVGFAIFFFSLTSLLSHDSAISTLEALHKEGRITDPIDAMIYLERAKAEGANWRFLLSFIGSMILSIGGVSLIFYFLPKIMPNYVFYWGDAITDYDRRISIVKIVWITIILGAVASILGGIVLSYFTK